MSTAPVPAVRELEVELTRLPGVRAARVVTDGADTPTEVHIVATPEKHAKQLVRDVQTVALASFGIDLDRRIVSVVQIDDQSPLFDAQAPKLEVLATTEPRTRLKAVTVAATEASTRVTVDFERGDDEGRGEATGPPLASLLPRLAADAALAAVRDLEPLSAPLAIEVAAVSDIGGRRIATVSVVSAAFAGDEILTGSAAVRNDDASAVARAVLDAVNRRLPALR